MATQFRVEKIVGSSEWASNFGPMVGWQLSVRNLSNDQIGFAALNSKPGNKYEVGQTFWADVQGEKNGVAKLKRVQPPQAGGNSHAAAPQQSGNAIPYGKALATYRRFAEDLPAPDYPPEYSTTMFIAWLKGQIGDPPQGQREPGDDVPWPED